MSEIDPRETRSSDDREAALMHALRATVQGAQAETRHYGATLAQVQASGLRERADLAALPVLRKSDLIALQEAQPPFGGVARDEAAAMARLFLSPGPIAEPQTGGSGDEWRFSRALRAVGIEEVVAVDIGNPNLPFAVVRIVVPGLEAALEGPATAYVPGMRAAAVLTQAPA